MAETSVSLFEQAVLPLFEGSPPRAAWLAEARAVARKLGKDGRTVCINDVRAVCAPPAEFDPRIMGAVFLRAEWDRLGYASNSRTTCHARPIALFRLKQFAR